MVTNQPALSQLGDKEDLLPLGKEVETSSGIVVARLESGRDTPEQEDDLGYIELPQGTLIWSVHSDGVKSSEAIELAQNELNECLSRIESIDTQKVLGLGSLIKARLKENKIAETAIGLNLISVDNEARKATAYWYGKPMNTIALDQGVPDISYRIRRTRAKGCAVVEVDLDDLDKVACFSPGVSVKHLEAGLKSGRGIKRGIQSAMSAFDLQKVSKKPGKEMLGAGVIGLELNTNLLKNPSMAVDLQPVVEDVRDNLKETVTLEG